MLSVSEIQQLCHRYSLPIQSDMAVEGYPWPVGHGGPGYHKPDQQIGPFGASRGRKADVAETTVAVTDAPLGAYPVPAAPGSAGSVTVSVVGMKSKFGSNTTRIALRGSAR